MKKYYLFTLTITLLLLLNNAHATFDLFDPDRGKPPPPPPSPPTKVNSAQLSNPFRVRPSETQPKVEHKKPLRPQKDFTLRGTSRVGNRRAVILQGPDNKEFVQPFKNNERTVIKGYEDQFFLLSVTSRKVTIEYPEDAPCRKSDEKKGIFCNAEGKTATLNLERSEALPPPPKPRVSKQPPKKGETKEEAKKREEARKKRQQLYKSFNKKVIKDEDVPPGMRVVRTPFGDRLVPIK